MSKYGAGVLYTLQNVKRGGKEIEKWTEVNILKPLKGKHHLAATQTLGLVNVSPGNYVFAGLQAEPGQSLDIY